MHVPAPSIGGERGHAADHHGGYLDLTDAHPHGKALYDADDAPVLLQTDRRIGAEAVLEEPVRKRLGIVKQIQPNRLHLVVIVLCQRADARHGQMM